MPDVPSRILIIDDDADYRQATRVLLEANGYAVTEAATAQEGIASFTTDPPDLVIVDLMMEEIDTGEKILARIRQEDPDVPVYLASAVGDQFYLSTDHTALGLAGILQKPVDPDRLLGEVRRRLSQTS